MSAEVPDVFAWERAFFRLYEWLEDDRDRREVVISSDSAELWRAGLCIDGNEVHTASGNSLPEVLTQVMEGMVVK